MADKVTVERDGHVLLVGRARGDEPRDLARAVELSAERDDLLDGTMQPPSSKCQPWGVSPGWTLIARKAESK